MNKKNEEILKKIKGGLIVSCQALSTEPLYDSYIMSKMAYAAMLGGAVGIRANTIADIKAIKKEVELPIIGIIKEEYENSDVYISPTMKEIDALVEEGCDIIATDATKRLRPGGKTFEEFFTQVREKYPDQLFMADTSYFEEGELAARLGCDLIGTTMAGYTPYTKGRKLPDVELIKKYASKLDKPIIAEGGIWVPQDLLNVYNAGAYSAVCGTAITRPMDITKRFVNALEETNENSML